MRRWSSFGRPVRGRRGGSRGSNRSHCRSIRSKRPINRRWVSARPSATPLQTRPRGMAGAEPGSVGLEARPCPNNVAAQAASGEGGEDEIDRSIRAVNHAYEHLINTIKEKIGRKEHESQQFRL